MGLEGCLGKPRQVQRQRHTPLIGLGGRVLWASLDKAGWVNANQKCGVFVRLMGVLSKGCITGRPWKMKET